MSLTKKVQNKLGSNNIEECGGFKCLYVGLWVSMLKWGSQVESPYWRFTTKEWGPAKFYSALCMLYQIFCQVPHVNELYYYIKLSLSKGYLFCCCLSSLWIQQEVSKTNKHHLQPPYNIMSLVWDTNSHRYKIVRHVETL